MYLCIAKEKDKVPWMSGLVSGLQNRARRFESARNLHKILITSTTCTGVVIRIFLFIDTQHISNFHPPTAPHRQAAQKRCAPSPPGMYAIFARDGAHPVPIPSRSPDGMKNHAAHTIKKQRERLRFPVNPLPLPTHLSAKYQSVVKQHVARDFGEFRRVRLSQTYGSLRPVRRPAANDMSEKYRFHFVQSGCKRH